MPLDLGHRPALGRDDFLVGESNAAAVAWVDAWPDWPARGLVLHGPEQSGKSHLAAVWCARSDARTIAAADIQRALVPELAGGARSLVLEEADRIGDEIALLHLYNIIRERQGYLLLTALTAPSRWPVQVPDLRSRLAALPVVELGRPDDQLFRQILAKHFSDRQVTVAAEVINYLTLRLERTAAAAAEAAERLDRDALSRGRPITLAAARRLVEGLLTPEKS